jgi:hypothetical protein
MFVKDKFHDARNSYVSEVETSAANPRAALIESTER